MTFSERSIKKTADRLAEKLKELLPHDTNRHSLLGDFGYLRNEAEAAIRLRSDLEAAERERDSLSRAMNEVGEIMEQRDRAERERDEARAEFDVDSRTLERLERDLATVREAAQAFIDTMGIRHSDRAGREVPSGFTATSNQAAIALYDALRSLDGEGS